jgi:hypothetical protein
LEEGASVRAGGGRGREGQAAAGALWPAREQGVRESSDPKFAEHVRGCDFGTRLVSQQLAFDVAASFRSRPVTGGARDLRTKKIEVHDGSLRGAFGRRYSSSFKKPEGRVETRKGSVGNSEAGVGGSTQRSLQHPSSPP